MRNDFPLHPTVGMPVRTGVHGHYGVRFEGSRYAHHVPDVDQFAAPSKTYMAQQGGSKKGLRKPANR